MQMELNLIKPRLATSVNVNIRALVKAVGIRPNYTEYNYDTKSIKYINEKNAFGDGIALNKNAILLYMYLHFLNVNANAHAVLDIYEASKYLSISERTVIHNMKILNHKGYLRFCEGDLSGTYHIFIDYYADNNLPASRGGSGFITLTRNIFDKLRTLRTINALRFAIRGLMDQFPGKQNVGTSTGCDLSKLKTVFPSYTQVKDIYKILSNSTIKEMFDIAIAASGKYIKINATKSFDPRKERQELIAKSEKKIREFFDSMNLKYPDDQIHPSKKEFHDIGKIALRIPLDNITMAIKQVYVNNNGTPIRNLPAYIRTLANRIIS